jgi:hypothetical protein
MKSQLFIMKSTQIMQLITSYGLGLDLQNSEYNHALSASTAKVVTKMTQ